MIRPVEYKVLIKPRKVEEKTEGGIFIPDSAKEKEEFAKAEGEIIAVGAIAFTDPPWLDCPKVGDFVIFDRYAGVEVEEYRLINDKEILAVIEG